MSMFEGMDGLLREMQRHYLDEMRRSDFMWELMNNGGKPAFRKPNLRWYTPLWPWRQGQRVRARWSDARYRLSEVLEVARHGIPECDC